MRHKIQILLKNGANIEAVVDVDEEKAKQIYENARFAIRDHEPFEIEFLNPANQPIRAVFDGELIGFFTIGLEGSIKPATEFDAQGVAKPPRPILQK